MTQTASVVPLNQDSLAAFQSYIDQAESRMEPTLDGREPFLWADTDLSRSRRVRRGDIPAQLWSGDSPVHVTDSLIHDWIAAAYIRGTTVAKTLDRVQDYDNHKTIYQPEVMDSRLISHHGNHFTFFLRLLKKKIITVVLDSYHDVHYQRVSDVGWFCRSYTTRIAEVDDAGTRREKIYPSDTGYGFMWRLYSYWRFAGEKDGVVVECRAISLTRDIPYGLGFIIEPIIKNLPRESLVNTLRATRNALQSSD